jgi:hypothetical protein
MTTTEQFKWWGAWMRVAVAGLLSCGATALAGEPATAPSRESAAIFGDNLENLRGGDAETTISIQNSQDLTASVEDVSISAGTINTGAVNIGERALENFSGVGVFNLVTGNNNAVNSGVEVTFTLE